MDYKMQIVIMRHGKPDVLHKKRIIPSEFNSWIKEYDLATISESSIPEHESLKIADEADAVVCSNLLRSRESAYKLGITNVFLSDDLFNEASMPYLKINFPKVSITLLLILCRILWLFGYSKNVESFEMFKIRSKKAAKYLHEIALKNKKVLFVGHGFINGQIAKNLIKLGWVKKTQRNRNTYWGYCIFNFNKSLPNFKSS